VFAPKTRLMLTLTAATLLAPACLDAWEERQGDDVHADAGDAFGGAHWSAPGPRLAPPLEAVGAATQRREAAETSASAQRAIDPTVEGGAAWMEATLASWLETVGAGSEALTLGPAVTWLADAASEGARVWATARAQTTRAPLPVDWITLVADGQVLLAEADGGAFDAWAAGPARFVRRGHGHYVLAREVALEWTPRWARDHIGRAVTLLDADGVVCEARVEGLALRSEFLDFNDLSEWFGLEDLVVDRERQPAEEAWEDGDRSLMGVLATDDPRCAAALGRARWAVDAERPAPVALPRVAAPARLATRAIRAFRAHPAWERVQGSFLAELASYDREADLQNTRWDTWRGGEPEVSLHRSAAGRTVAVVRGDANGGCGDPGAQLTVAFEVTHRRGAPHFEAIHSAERFWTSEALFDLRGDGQLFTITGEPGLRVAQLDEGDLHTTHWIYVMDRTLWGCGC